jgi:putative transposase
MNPRKIIRLSAKNYLGQTAIFVTLCCLERRRHFEHADSCLATLEILRETSTTRDFALHAYCFMPDHLHLLVEGLSPTSDFLNFIKAFKLRSSRAFAGNHHATLWQDKFFDHILRKPDAYESVCLYIWMNPVRAGLAARLGDYPFAGSFTRQILGFPSNITPWCPPKSRGPLRKAGPTKT